MRGVDDAELVHRTLEGDMASFGVLVERYRRPVFTLALRMLGNRPEAEDIASEAFLRVHARLRRYDPERSFGTWILIIASRLCLDALRRRRWHGGSVDEAMAEGRAPPTEEPGPDAQALAGDLGGRVRDAVEKLPERERMAVVLRHLMDMSYREVATAMGIPIGTAKTLAYQGRRKLVALLEERGDAE